MKYIRCRKALAAILVFMLLFSSVCFAEELSLIQKIMYRKESLVTPDGKEVPVLVMKFTNKVKYSLEEGKWKVAPANFQNLYDNRRKIESAIDKLRSRNLNKSRRKTGKKNPEKL